MQRSNAFAGSSQFPWASGSYWPTSDAPPADVQSCPPESLDYSDESSGSYNGPYYGSLDEGPFDMPCDPIADLICSDSQ